MSYQLIEMLKSSDNLNKWDEVALSLRSGFKDHGDKINQISKSLMVINSYINKSGRPLNFNRDKPTEYIKMICKQKNLIYSETPRNGHNCLELSGECFRVVIVMQDSRLMHISSKTDLIKQVLIEYNKEKPTNCPELQKSLSDGEYSLLLLHIEELIQLYSVGNDRTQQLKAFLCLQSLEEDINKLAQCQIVSKLQTDCNIQLPQPTNIIGIIKPRSGGIPSQFVFYCPKSSPTYDPVNERFNIMVQLMPHNENNLLPFIPLVNLQKDNKGNCSPSYVTADSLKCVSLAAKFVLKLSQPLVLSDAHISAITSITGLNVIMTKDYRCNYVDVLLEQAGSPLTCQDRFYSILLNDKQIAFQIVNNTAIFNGHVVVSIPFLLPSQLPKIVAIIKKQSIINVMMESFLLTNAATELAQDCLGAQPINITLVSHDELICSFITSGNNGTKIKFSIAYNENGQSIVNMIDPRKSDHQFVECPQKVTEKYNNLPMIIFWLLYRCGDTAIKESASFITVCAPTTDTASLADSIQHNDDLKLAKDYLALARSSVRIRSTNDKEIFPKIKIEPKLELLTTTYQQQIVNSPSLVSHHDMPKVLPPMTINNHEHALLPTQDYQGTFQNQYLQHPNNCHLAGPNNINPNTGSNPMSSNLMACNQSLVKNEHYQPCPTHGGNKHMSLDQMLSSDFAMPFASDGIGQYNPMAHSMHYADNPNNQQVINNVFGGHGSNFKDSPNAKIARQVEIQSSVLVNLLNNNENSTSSNTNLLSRQISTTLNPPSFSPNSYLNDQLDTTKNIQSQMLRGSQMPRMRMPHPNQNSKPNFTPNYNNMSSIASLPINRAPSTCKSDIMMMPYPQDTGNVRSASTRKPRKRRAPNLELNQRLPKLQSSQFPMIQQPTPNEAMHLPNMQMSHLQPASASIVNHSQSSSSNASFSSPTTMDQSVYDFDDNVEFSRIRTMSSSNNSSISPHSNVANNLNRRLSSSGSKKSLKVRISRKMISQNSSMDSSNLDSQLSANYESDQKNKDKSSSMCRSNTMPNISNIILSGPSSTSSANTVIGIASATTTSCAVNITHSRPTAIMSAIDSPVTCSSISSIQTSPYGSQHNCDSTEIKKRRKRRLKPDPNEDVESALKREKLEARKQNRKKKEIGSISGMSSHGSMENLSILNSDSTLKPPLPIKLSVNTKMGSVSNNTARNPKVAMSTPSPLVNQPIGVWNTQTGNLAKPSSKESKLSVEPILRNYKIPKKKSSAENHVSQESLHGLQSMSLLNKLEHVSKSSKDLQDPIKSEMSSSGFVDRPKSPEMSSFLNQNQFIQSSSLNSEQDTKPSHENQSNSTAQKTKNIHEIAEILHNKVSNSQSVTTSNITPSADMLQLKVPEYNQSGAENIFDKFAASKVNSKPEYRQFPTNRLPDDSMNSPKYPYNSRPPAVYPQPRAPPPVASPNSFNYNVRQPYINNTPVYRMDTAAPRNFPSINNAPTTYQKKNDNNNAFPNRKK